MVFSSVDSFMEPRFNVLCSIFYSLIRVRGKKNAGMYFSHDLPLFFPLSTAIQHTSGRSVPWKTRCVLLYWLSVVLLNPYQFDESTLPVLTSLPSAVHLWVLHDDPLGEMGAYFLAVLFSRRFFPSSACSPTSPNSRQPRGSLPHFPPSPRSHRNPRGQRAPPTC